MIFDSFSQLVFSLAEATVEHVLAAFYARPRFMYDFLLHEIETHGDESHSQHQVDGREYETDLYDFTLYDRITRDNVAEADGRERDETEVGAVEETPVFPSGKEECATADVPVS